MPKGFAGREENPTDSKRRCFPRGYISTDRSRYDSIVDAFYNHIGKPEIVDLDAELRKHMKYKAISKPVFLQEYRYAFIHLERRTSFL